MMKWFKRKKRENSASPQEVFDESPTSEELDAAEDSEAPPKLQEEAPADRLGEEEYGEADLRESSLPTEGLEAEEDLPDSPKEKGRLFKRLRERLHKTRENFVSRVDRLLLGKKTIDLDLLDDLEEVLITSDLGVRTAQVLLGKVAEKIKRNELSSPDRLREELREEIREILSVPATPWNFEGDEPFVIMVVGVNGVGKTTTIGKLAHQLKRQEHNVMLVAADTFRAAAIEQLSIWGERANVPVIRQKSGSDPSAVAFDGMDAALSRDMDVVLLDTAGRMHTKVNLMEELKKVMRVVTKKIPDAPHEVLLVLDATTGQNALSQARLFKEGIGITGLILTKLDGTAKGGIIVAICEELKVPVRYIGIGEGLDDLRPFDPEEFTNALF